MGRKSIRENKNIYQISREAARLTLEQASEKLQFLSADKIGKIESGKSFPHPEDVLAMADCYKNPMMCNHFCANECPIGQEYVPEVRIKNLSQVVLEMLATLNALNKEKERLVEITVDGQISDDELDDFRSIQRKLNQMSLAIDSMKLWVENQIAAGTIDESFLD